MMESKYIRLIDALIICALTGASVSSCSEQEEFDVSPSLSDAEITFSVSDEWTPIGQSRATWLERADYQDKAKGGGNFTLYAYLADTGQEYINSARGWCFVDPGSPAGSGQWMMLDADGSPRTYYWPYGKALNFFAYMPNKAYNGSEGYVAGETYVAIDGYTKEDGMRFTYAPPGAADVADASLIEDTREFIYAYEANKQNREEAVNLRFHHPFALVNFKLAPGSYRMKIEELVFNQIYLGGTFSTVKREWNHAGYEKKTVAAKIGKRIPNDQNYNSYLSDWFVVLPQDLSGVTLTLSASRDETNVINKSFSLDNLGNGVKWEQGKKYTYIINYGDKNEEIYFNVEVASVDMWNEHEYQHDVNVE